jgi:hypothetical protein
VAESRRAKPRSAGSKLACPHSVAILVVLAAAPQKKSFEKKKNGYARGLPPIFLRSFPLARAGIAGGDSGALTKGGSFVILVATKCMYM